MLSSNRKLTRRRNGTSEDGYAARTALTKTVISFKTKSVVTFVQMRVGNDMGAEGARGYRSRLKKTIIQFRQLFKKCDHVTYLRWNSRSP